MKSNFDYSSQINQSSFHHKSVFHTLRGFLNKDSFNGYLFISPLVIGFLIFMLFPIVWIFVNSLTTHNLLSGKITFVGLANYISMFTTDPFFGVVLKNSLIFSGGLLVLNLMLSLLLAILLAQQFSGVTFFRTIFFAPVVVSSVAWALIFSFLMQGEQGFINQALSFVGINGPNWLVEPTWAMISIIVTRVLKNVGLNMLLFIAALQDLPKEHVEAAQIDGADRLNITRYITLPHLAPTILLVVTINIIYSLNVFDHIMLLTQGGPGNATMVLSYYVYYTAFQVYDIGYASSNSVILFLIAMGLTVIQWTLRRRYTDEN